MGLSTSLGLKLSELQMNSNYHTTFIQEPVVRWSWVPVPSSEEGVGVVTSKIHGPWTKNHPTPCDSWLLGIVGLLPVVMHMIWGLETIPLELATIPGNYTL